MSSINTIERSIVINADREKVWRAITTPEQFSKWFEADIRFTHLAVGEDMTFDFGSVTGTAKIAIVEPRERFGYRWAPDPGSSTQTLVTFQLKEVPGGTRLTVTEEGYAALPDEIRERRYKLNSEGWGIQVNNVAKYVRGLADGRK